MHSFSGPDDLRQWVSAHSALEDGVAALREAGVPEDLLEDGRRRRGARGGRVRAQRHLRGGGLVVRSKGKWTMELRAETKGTRDASKRYNWLCTLK